jgi:phage-related protein
MPSINRLASLVSITCIVPFGKCARIWATRIARTLFAVEGAQMILLHGFIKKTQRTPNDDIDLAEKRFKEWQHGEK